MPRPLSYYIDRDLRGQWTLKDFKIHNELAPAIRATGGSKIAFFEHYGLPGEWVYEIMEDKRWATPKEADRPPIPGEVRRAIFAVAWEVNARVRLKQSVIIPAVPGNDQRKQVAFAIARNASGTALSEPDPVSGPIILPTDARPSRAIRLDGTPVPDDDIDEIGAGAGAGILEILALGESVGAFAPSAPPATVDGATRGLAIPDEVRSRPGRVMGVITPDGQVNHAPRTRGKPLPAYQAPLHITEDNDTWIHVTALEERADVADATIGSLLEEVGVERRARLAAQSESVELRERLAKLESEVARAHGRLDKAATGAKALEQRVTTVEQGIAAVGEVRTMFDKFSADVQAAITKMAEGLPQQVVEAVQQVVADEVARARANVRTIDSARATPTDSKRRGGPDGAV